MTRRRRRPLPPGFRKEISQKIRSPYVGVCDDWSQCLPSLVCFPFVPQSPRCRRTEIRQASVPGRVKYVKIKNVAIPDTFDPLGPHFPGVFWNPRLTSVLTYTIVDNKDTCMTDIFSS